MDREDTKNIKPRVSEIVEWYGRLDDAPPYPDLKYWLSQPDAAKFQTVRDMIIEAHLMKGEDLRGARLQRDAEHFERGRR